MQKKKRHKTYDCQCVCTCLNLDGFEMYGPLIETIRYKITCDFIGLVSFLIILTAMRNRSANLALFKIGLGVTTHNPP